MLNVLIVFKTPNDLIIEAFDGNNVEVYSGGAPLGQRVSKGCYDIVLLENRMESLKDVKEADPRSEVFLIGSAGIDEVEAVKLGASAYFTEPVDFERLRTAVMVVNDLARSRKETAQLETQLSAKYTFAGVIGRNPQMLEIFSLLRRISPYFKTVTIMGETGTGKEEIAKALHNVSPSASKPFVACNCGGLVEHLIESELFGHKKGAFTGAINDKAGIFEAAGDGTVFLDEIGDLPLLYQPHLLRVLQTGEFRRVGSTQTQKAKCRVIAATNKDLVKETKEGRFREDLFFRLTPLTIQVPPLRDRKDDIPLISRALLNRFTNRTGKKVSGISRQAQAAMITYNWPGNVRELENVIEQAAMLSTEPFIRHEYLPQHISNQKSVNAGNGQFKTLDELIKEHIETALRQCASNKTNAAKALGISRRAFFRKLEKYGIA